MIGFVGDCPDWLEDVELFITTTAFIKYVSWLLLNIFFFICVAVMATNATVAGSQVIGLLLPFWWRQVPFSSILVSEKFRTE